MAGATITNGQPATSGEFHLYIQGRDFIDKVPLDIAPITWSDEVGGGVPTMQFTVEDLTPWPASGNQPLKLGRRVRFTRNGVALFAGHIVDLTYVKVIKGRHVLVTVAGYDAWLDWKIVPRWSNRKNSLGNKRTKRNRYFRHDDVAVKQLVRKRAGFIQVGRFVDRTTGVNSNAQLGRIVTEEMTLRQTLEEIAEDANWDGVTRRFYVDHNMELHWYKGIESGQAAPFNVTDQEYAALVTSHANIREFWPMTEADPTADYVGRLGVKDLQVILGTPTNGQRLVTNQPGLSKTGDSSTVLVNIPAAENAGAALTASGGWAVEYWVNDTDGFSASPYVPLCFGGTADPEVRINPAYIQLRNRGDATFSRWTYTFNANTTYHVVVGQNSGGTDYCYINGVDQGAADSGGGCSAFGDDWTSFTVHRNAFGVVGDMSHWAWYTGDGLTAAEALAHYEAGLSIVPEGMQTSHNAEAEYHKIYVVGANAKGSGWFGPINSQRSEWSARAKQRFLRRRKSNTNLKRRKAARNWLKRREPIHSGIFSISDPVHAAGWKAGQVVEVTDSYLGDEGGPYSGERFQVAAVRGQYGPRPDQVRVDVDFGTIRRSVLRELR